MNLLLRPVKDIQKALLKDFNCGEEPLNVYLARYAQKNDALGIGKTFVAISDAGNVAGYFTLSTAQIKFEEFPADYNLKLPRYPIPAIRLARLAVDKDMHGQGIGKWLLKQAFQKVLHVADIAAVHAVIVDAKEGAKGFYRQFGFVELNAGQGMLFLPVATIREAAERRNQK